MADADAGATELCDLFVVEVNGVREPHAVAQPAALAEIVGGRHAVACAAILRLGLGLDEMRVQPAVVLLGERRALAHQAERHVEGRVGRERHLQHRAVGAVVIAADDALAIGEDGVVVLRHALRRHRLGAVLLRLVERAACERHADADARRLLGLDVHRVIEPGGEEVVVIVGAGAARHEQLGHGEPRREPERPRVHVLRPHRIERDDPWPERAVDAGRVRARQRLEEVMVGVDQPGDDHVARCVEDPAPAPRLLPATDQFDDATVLDDEATLAAIGEHSDGVLYPEAHPSVPLIPAQAGTQIFKGSTAEEAREFFLALR